MKTLLTFAVAFLVSSTAFATINFCGGGQYQQNFGFAFAGSNFPGTLPNTPVNGIPLLISKTRGLAARNALVAGGQNTFLCPNAPVVSAGQCQAPWINVQSPATQLEDCGCPTDMIQNLVPDPFFGAPTLPQRVTTAVFDTPPAITDQDVATLQNWPDPIFAATYAKFVSLTNPGAFASTLLGMVDSTTNVAGVATTRIVVPYRPNWPLPANSSVLVMDGIPNPGEPAPIGCVWFSRVYTVNWTN